MAELADALDLGSCAGNGVGVRLPPLGLIKNKGLRPFGRKPLFRFKSEFYMDVSATQIQDGLPATFSVEFQTIEDPVKAAQPLRRILARRIQLSSWIGTVEGAAAPMA